MTTINRVEMEAAGSSQTLEQYSLNVQEPQYLGSQIYVTAHFSTTLSTFRNSPFLYYCLTAPALTVSIEMFQLSATVHFCTIVLPYPALPISIPLFQLSTNAHFGTIVLTSLLCPFQ